MSNGSVTPTSIGSGQGAAPAPTILSPTAMSGFPGVTGGQSDMYSNGLAQYPVISSSGIDPQLQQYLPQYAVSGLGYQTVYSQQLAQAIMPNGPTAQKEGKIFLGNFARFSFCCKKAVLLFGLLVLSNFRLILFLYFFSLERILKKKSSL